MKFNNILLALTFVLGINSNLYAENNEDSFGTDTIDILTVGTEYTYIEDVKPSIETASPFEIEMSKKFGTYEDLKNGKVVSTGKVWLGTVVKKNKENKCFAVTRYAAKNHERIGIPEVKQAIDQIPCEELSLGRIQYSSTTPNNKKIGLFSGDKEIVKIQILSEEYQTDGSLKKIAIFDYKNKQRRQCALFMNSNKDSESYRDFNPERRICYPYYGF